MWFWGEDGVTRVKVGKGVTEERTKINQMLACHCLFLESMTSQIMNRTKIMLNMSTYKSDNEIKIGIIQELL